MKHTRKQKPTGMSIPQLRKSFDHIESFTARLLHSEKDPKKRRKSFQDEWMKTFHRAVDDKSADAYLQFEAKKGKKASKTRKHQRGGATLAGAPLDYSTRPGIYGVYGQFPEYISSGFSFGNDINKMAIQEGCNSPAEAAKFQMPYTGFGAPSLAQKGGKSRKRNSKTKKSRKQRGGAPTWGEFASAASFRPLSSSFPPSTAYSSLMEFKGAEPYPSSNANTGSPPYQSIKPSVINPQVSGITRNLGSEV